MAGLGDASGGCVDGIGLGSTKRHVDNNTLGAVLVATLLGNVVHTSNDTGIGSLARGIKDLDSEQLSLLGDTIGLAGNGARDVSAVALAIGVITITREVLQPLSTTLEFLQKEFVSQC